VDYLRVGCASIIGWVFLVSAVSKLRGYREFRKSLPALAPVRPGLLRPLAVVVVVSEATVPILLLIPSAMSYGFWLSCGLLCAFSAAIAAALRRGRRVPCRCFGASSTPLGAGHLVRNTIILITAVMGVVAPSVHPPAAGVAVAIGTGLVGAILIIAFDDIVYLFARSS
jgi:hypothetical protein